jgi:type I restriction enzyme, S subunit
MKPVTRDGYDELPEGWVGARVGDMFRMSGGGTPNRGTPQFWSGSIPWLSSGDIKTDRIFAGSDFITDAGLKGSSARMCAEGSVVVVVRSGILRHTLPIAVLQQPAAINQDLRCFDCGNASLNEWLALALRAFSREILEENREGTTVQSVKSETLRGFALRLPPLVEQRRIVAKVEELLGRVSAARERLAKVPTLVKRFRQSVLAAACAGKLTEDWRTDQSNAISAEAIRATIAEERRRRWIAAEVARLERAARKPQEDLDDRYEPPNGLDEMDLPHLPENWVWLRAEEGCDFITKGTTPPPNRMTAGDGEIPYIKVYNLTDRGHLDFRKNPTYIDRRTHSQGSLARSKVLPGDVLMNLVGPPLGKVSVVPDTFPEWNTNQAVAIYRPVSHLLNSYLAMVLLTDDVLGWAVQRSKATVGQHNLTLELARNLPIPVPPIQEQREIVRRVDALFALADKLEARTKSAIARVEKITQATLAKAFRGELVPTEAELAREEGRDYEPASALLERIRAEREAADNGPTRPKTKNSNQLKPPRAGRGRKQGRKGKVL